MGRMLIGIGALLIVAGLVVEFGGPFGLGRLPGDIALKGERWSFNFPIVTCLVLSAAISVAAWTIGRFFR